MAHRFSFPAWLRALIAASLVLASFSQAPAAAAPDWVAAGICHAPADDTPDQPAHAAHDHCSLCQVAQAVGLPPSFVSWAYPTLIFATSPADAPVARALPLAFRAYASRAPPRIG